jgi:hypothetical protein
MKRKTNFDKYVEEQLKDVVFAGRFKKSRGSMGCRVGTRRLEKRMPRRMGVNRKSF